MDWSSFSCKQLWLIILLHKCVYFLRRAISRHLELVTTGSSLLWRNGSEHHHGDTGWVCMSRFGFSQARELLTSLRISFLTWTWGMHCLATGVCSAVPSRQCRQRWAWYLLILKPHSVVCVFLSISEALRRCNNWQHIYSPSSLTSHHSCPPIPLFLLVFPTTSFSFSVTELLKIVYVAIAGVLC